jgi:hypothetical protein
MKRELSTELGGEPFASLPALQEEHFRLADRADEVEAAESQGQSAAADGLREQVMALRDEVAHFEQRAAATGTVLDEPRDREFAQSLLDYWCVRRGSIEHLAALLPEAGGPDSEARSPPAPPRPMTAFALAPFDERSVPALDDADYPYAGLNPYGAGGARFEGRETAVASLKALIERHRLIVVSGPSGAGKSSVVLAGLVPLLRGGAVENSAGWTYWPPVTPGSDPIAALLNAIRPAGADAEAWLASHRPKVEKKPAKLAEVAAEAGAGDAPSLLIVDQVGELFTMAPEASWEPFAAAIVALTTVEAPRHRALILIRDEFLDRLRALGPFAGAADLEVFPVPPMTGTELRTAIEQPAAAVGLKFDPGIVDELVRDLVNEPSPLTLLQFSLLQLWKRRERNRITFAAYEQVGRPNDAVNRAAEEAFGSLDPEREQPLVRALFLALVSPMAEDQFVRRRLRRSDLNLPGDPAALDSVLARFADAGLIRRTASPSASDDRYEVVHEALPRHWCRLKTWLQEQATRDDRKLLVLNRARLWDRSGRKGDYLADGEALAAAAEFEGEDLLIGAYVAASREASTKRRRTRVGLGSGALVAFGLMVGAIAFLALLPRSGPLGDLFNQIVAADPQPKANDPVELRAEGPGTPGFILIGTDDQPLLADAGGRTPVPPNEVAPNNQYRLRLSVPIYAAAPAGDEALPEPAARAEQGALVYATGRYTTVRREGGEQYWLPVRLVPRVLIRYPGNDPTRARAVAQDLRAHGFDAVSPASVPTAAVKPLVRYFHPQDEAPASDLADELRRINFDVQVLPPGDAAADAERGTLEVWLNPDAQAARPAGGDAGAPARSGGGGTGDSAGTAGRRPRTPSP